MSDKPLNPNGKSYDPGKGDELEKYIIECGKSARSELEVETLEFRPFRHGDEFRLLEIFDESIGGFLKHKESKAFQQLSDSGLVASIGIRFYDEVKW
ncbi:hypothetical protein JCM8097_001585 [Rhodosporidiobolus ruineniae]